MLLKVDPGHRTIKRRTFLGVITGGLLAAPLVAEAQSTRKVYRVGCLWPGQRDQIGHLVDAFEVGLRELGYIEGSTILLDRRFADGRFERLPELAADLVRLRMDVIFAVINAGIVAAKQATATIPIVMGLAQDPVHMGFIQSLSRPGGDLTGITFDTTPETVGKNVELLKEIVPTVSRLDILWNSAFPGRLPYVRVVEAAARRLGIAAYPREVKTVSDVDDVLAFFSGQPASALLVITDPVVYNRRREIAVWAMKNRRPTVFDFRESVDAGGLMSYGANMAELYRRAPSYVDRILKGAQPGDLPVEQPTKFELVINLKTAKALGLTIPPSLLQRADQVIE